jgi:hypothetical protein
MAAEAAGRKPRRARQEQSAAYMHTRLYDAEKSAGLARRLGWMLTPTEWDAGRARRGARAVTGPGGASQRRGTLEVGPAGCLIQCFARVEFFKSGLREEHGAGG